MAITHTCDLCGEPALEADTIAAASKTVIVAGDPEINPPLPEASVTVAWVITAPAALCGTCQQRAWTNYLQARYVARGIPLVPQG